MDNKIKYEMEFPIQASPGLLYQYISTPSGMQEWYADNVNSRGKFFNFIWEGSEEVAKLISKKKGESIRLQWEDDEDTDYYFEMRIQLDAITKDVSIMVTDFAEEDEVEEGKMLWENMISELKHLLGSV
ncbi:MAG: START-like domain-containing protein [Flavobacteriaceae bacterium]|nr:START-like domain-containing protein [Flavobacteriaceae bacterium]